MFRDDFDFCPYCGTKSPEPKICLRCGFESVKYDFCPKCGIKLSEEEGKNRIEPYSYDAIYDKDFHIIFCLKKVRNYERKTRRIQRSN